MPLFAIFTETGIPGWIGDWPREGSEELPEVLRINDDEVPVGIAFLAAHLRTPDGKWQLRPPPAPPSEAELAARQEYLARQQTEAEAEAARSREDEIVRRSGPDQLLRSMGKITIAELTARVAAIRADVEAGL